MGILLSQSFSKTVFPLVLTLNPDVCMNKKIAAGGKQRKDRN